ncbi:MAG: universal stress protein [Actinobacteria bacterium]|nr:MAG: universal stress protein [Actinomycetota bacterium]
MKAMYATDLSEPSLAALDWLFACQKEDFEEVILLHVIDIDMYTEGGSLPLFLETGRKLLEENAARLRERGLNVRTRVEQGRVVHEIHRVAAEEEAGLVVVANVGRGGLAERALGGTAEAAAAETRVPVLVEKVSGEAGKWCRATAGHTFARTVVAVDFSDTSRQALRTVSSFAGVRAILLVHVAGGAEVADLGSEEERRLRLDEWALLAEGIKVERELREGDPVPQIEDAASAWGATCIAAGLCGHGFVHRIRWGSVSRELARTAELPVLLVPPAETERGGGS